MKMKSTKLWGAALALTIASLFACTFFIVQYARTPIWDIYEGEEVFLTEQEYTNFKFAVLDENIQEWEVDALTSRPPIVVKFKITVPYGCTFNYGERIRTVSKFSDRLDLWICLPIGLSTSTLALAYLLSSKPGEENGSQTNRPLD